MVQSDLDVLLDMGFEKERAEIAAKKSGGLQGALQWLEDNQDKSLEDIKKETATQTESTNAESHSDDTNDSANSLVCNECGKLFKNADLATFHATKSGHTDFSESTEAIKPLTEEEKQAKLQDLREKLKAKRAAQSVNDQETQRQNEKIRMKATKETQDAKEKLQREEQLRQVAKKRQEKEADKQALARARAQIEANKEARRQKEAAAKAAREGRAGEESVTAPVPTPAASSSAPKPAHSEARLRLQTPSGNIMKTLPAETTLAELAQVVASENGFQVTSFSTTFPRKTFEGAVDFSKTLKEVGFVPNAAVVVK
ncbi:UBA-like protein [Ceratocystis lukuohia]|uniref:UBA-like protein n=1 Tax=Ceratocystis lukuohia TaxID=2019550 RepID=A0ABR4MKR6_9PEZI